MAIASPLRLEYAACPVRGLAVNGRIFNFEALCRCILDNLLQLILWCRDWLHYGGRDQGRTNAETRIWNGLL